MKRRSFLSLLAAAFASPLIGQLDGLCFPSTGQVGINVSWDWEAVEAIPAEWEAGIKWCAAELADRIDKQAAEYAYGVVMNDRR